MHNPALPLNNSLVGYVNGGCNHMNCQLFCFVYFHIILYATYVDSFFHLCESDTSPNVRPKYFEVGGRPFDLNLPAGCALTSS
jgi:hypothetical protein